MITYPLVAKSDAEHGLKKHSGFYGITEGQYYTTTKREISLIEDDIFVWIKNDQGHSRHVNLKRFHSAITAEDVK